MALSQANMNMNEAETIDQSSFENRSRWLKRGLICIFCKSSSLVNDALTYKGITVCARCLRLVPLVVNVLALSCTRCARKREAK
jgi:hypothetical protein